MLRGPIIGCVIATSALMLLTACGKQTQGENVDPQQVDATAAPAAGKCRKVAPKDLENTANASRIVECTQPHTAETFHVEELPDEFDNDSYTSSEVATYAARTCAPKFAVFLGADESLSMRSVIGWVWFRPSEAAWKAGARWIRCDAVGGNAASESLLELPPTVAGLFKQGPQEEWLACVNAPSVTDAPRVPCSKPHLWRAVTTIKLGNTDDDYPGDKQVADRTQDFCSGSVSAWLGYPQDFDFGYTWFGTAAWKAGNRRSVCWARTSK